MGSQVDFPHGPAGDIQEFFVSPAKFGDTSILTSGTLQQVFAIEPVSLDVHVAGRRLAERYGFSFFDATKVASALLANCELLYSEDMQDGLLVAERLRIRNPFMAAL